MSVVFARKGQSGAAVLVVLIALLIILYILFLPPAERAAILGETPSGTGGPGQPSADAYELLDIVPTVAQAADEDIRNLPPFIVRTETSGNILTSRDVVSLERSVFHSVEDELTFTVPAESDNLLLSFTALHSSGSLRISLNGNVIFDGPITQRQPAPIRLDKAFLQSVNTLSFEASTPGFAFWTTNRFSLTTVRVTADVTTRAQAAQTQRFVLRDTDESERTYVSFLPDCEERQGKLTVVYNNNALFSGVPECGVSIDLDLPPARMLEGENALEWEVDSGEYFIDNVAVITEYAPKQQVQAFTISSEMMNTIRAQGKQVHLELSFREPGARGAVVINGEELAFRTRQTSFSGPITQYVTQGTNSISLTSSTVSATRMRVFVQ